MISIGYPFVEEKEGSSFLCANIYDEMRKKNYLTWYSVDNQYSSFLCDDRVDGFLLVVLMIAIKSGQDIEIEAPVSSRFLFNLENTVIPLFEKIVQGGHQIHIFRKNLTPPRQLEGKAVGVGASLGVDSMASLLKHLDKNIPNDYAATHLALFNSCQFGYEDLEETEQIFLKAVENLRPFSEEVGLPIVAVNTNLNELYLESGIDTATARFIPSTISCVLALQKLFGKYVFASSYSVVDFAISHIDHSHAEGAFVPLLSTDSTEIILSNPVMTRVEKTNYIRSSALTPKYLDVCWADQVAHSKFKQVQYLEGKTKHNCGWCDKCLRTLFTLELFGENLDEYAERFDLSKYYSHRNSFLLNVLLNRHRNLMYNEIYILMKEKAYRIPISIRLWKLIRYNTVSIVISKIIRRILKY